VILYHALQSEPAIKGADEKRRDYDAAGSHTQACVWNLFLTADPSNQAIANVLADAIPRLPKIAVPYAWRVSVNGDKKTDWKDDQVKFLQVLFERWTVEREAAERKPYDWIPQQIIRELIAAKAPFYNEAAKQLIVQNADVFVRRGYYRAFTNETLENLKSYLEKDGDSFCEAAVNNPFFYMRANRAVYLWFAQQVRECKEPLDEYADSISYLHSQMQTKLFRQAPLTFFESEWEADDPVGYAASKRGDPVDAAAEEQQDIRLLTKIAEVSAVAQELANSRNWLLVAVAGAVGFIAGKF
jgi:hypothetical protein